MLCEINLKQKLKQILNGIPNKNFEIDLILMHVTGLKKEEIIFKKKFSKDQIKKAIKLSKKRAKGIPLQFLISNWEFFGEQIKVGKGVLIPRQETELLVEVALKLIKQNDVVLDLCAGSGCISLAIANRVDFVKIYAVEKFKRAIKFLKMNTKRCESIEIVKLDVLNEKSCEKFKFVDLIVSNPPYLSKKELKTVQKEVRFEPKSALNGGSDGLMFYRKIASVWKNSLKIGGFVIFEIGWQQKEAVVEILKKNEFKIVDSIKDYCGLDRVVVCQKMKD